MSERGLQPPDTPLPRRPNLTLVGGQAATLGGSSRSRRKPAGFFAPGESGGLSHRSPDPIRPRAAALVTGPEGSTAGPPMAPGHDFDRHAFLWYTAGHIGFGEETIVSHAQLSAGWASMPAPVSPSPRPGF